MLGCLLVGVLGLMGWVWSVPFLKSVVPGLRSISPNTALACILGGVALGLLHPRPPGPVRRALGMACAVGLGLIGALTLLQIFILPDLGIQALLFRWTDWAARTPPSLMVPPTAVCLVLLAGALLVLGQRAPAPSWWMDAPVILAVLIALFGFNGNIHGVLKLADMPHAILPAGMGLHTSVALILLGTGILCARPEQGLMGQLTRDTLGGFLARWLVPISLLGPCLLGVVLELLYREGTFHLPVKSALFSTAMSLGGVAIVLLSAHALNRIDTERRRATAALALSEARHRGVLETAPNAVLTVDGAGRVRFVNAEAEHLFGSSREELLGQEVERLVPGLLREEDGATPNPGRTLRARHKNGTELPVDVSLSPSTSPEGRTVTAILRDATERERYLDGLRAARAEAERERTLLEAVVEHAPVGILFVNPRTDEVRVNSALQGILGITMDPLAGRQQYLGRLRHQDGQPVRMEELPSSRALAGHEVAPEKYCIVRGDVKFPVLASAAPVREPSGEVHGAIVCIQDISAHEELERLREEYVGLISHDLRTPLQNIILRCQQLLRSLEAKHLVAEVAATEALLRNTRRMNGMVEELLEGSRLEAGQVTLHREPLDMIHFIEQIIDRDVPPDVRDRLRLEVATPVQWVPADPPRLERVLVNLLTNALKYSAPGTPVVVRLEQEAARVKVSVRDQGKGLTAEETQRLFTKYYRARGGRRQEGVGLGLYISRLIIEAHGGRIHVESTPGKGSTFIFTLPLLEQAGAREAGGMPSGGGGAPPQPS